MVYTLTLRTCIVQCLLETSPRLATCMGVAAVCLRALSHFNRLWVPHAVARSGPQTSLHVTSAKQLRRYVDSPRFTHWAVNYAT
jgi:hypothetical protein